MSESSTQRDADARPTSTKDDVGVVAVDKENVVPASSCRDESCCCASPATTNNSRSSSLSKSKSISFDDEDDADVDGDEESVGPSVEVDSSDLNAAACNFAAFNCAVGNKPRLRRTCQLSSMSDGESTSSIYCPRNDNKSLVVGLAGGDGQQCWQAGRVSSDNNSAGQDGVVPARRLSRRQLIEIYCDQVRAQKKNKNKKHTSCAGCLA